MVQTHLNYSKNQLKMKNQLLFLNNLSPILLVILCITIYQIHLLLKIQLKYEVQILFLISVLKINLLVY